MPKSARRSPLLSYIVLSLFLVSIAGLWHIFTLPPQLTSFNQEELAETACYHNRTNRNGVEPLLDYTKRSRRAQFTSHARITKGAQEKRVIHLTGRTL